MGIEIKQIGITEAKGATWGRVFVDYIENNETKFAFKNWIKFVSKKVKKDVSYYAYVHRVFEIKNQGKLYY